MPSILSDMSPEVRAYARAKQKELKKVILERIEGEVFARVIVSRVMGRETKFRDLSVDGKFGVQKSLNKLVSKNMIAQKKGMVPRLTGKRLFPAYLYN